MEGMKVRGVTIMKTVMRSVGELVVELRHRLSHSPPQPLATVGLDYIHVLWLEYLSLD